MLERSKMENEYMTTQEVMRVFRITKATLLKMIHEGRIRAFKVGNSYRFKKVELEEDLRVNKYGEVNKHEEVKAASR
jgi:excisionase family DNA binding protein